MMDLNMCSTSVPVAIASKLAAGIRYHESAI